MTIDVRGALITHTNSLGGRYVTREVRFGKTRARGWGVSVYQKTTFSGVPIPPQSMSFEDMTYKQAQAKYNEMATACLAVSSMQSINE